jgi:hypothetical protein
MKTLILAAIRCSLMFLVTALLFFAEPAQAYTVKLQQVGSNVVATGTGHLNVKILPFVGSVQIAGGAAIVPNSAIIQTGPTGLVNLDVYSGLFTGPTHFGSGGFFSANTGSGDFVGIHVLDGVLLVPHGYISGSALSDSMTFNNATFESLGVTPDTYRWKIGVETPNGLVYTTYNVWCDVPDGGSTVSLLGFGLLGLAALRRKLS